VGKKTMTDQVLTANRLGDGAVVYLTPSGTWSESIAESRIARDVNRDVKASETLLADGMALCSGNLADPPYLIDVTTDGGDVRPVRYRERIRAFGPSIHPEFAKQPAIRG
jgi:hypothetical protein